MDFPGPWTEPASAPGEAAVSTLPAAQMFALWAIRTWVTAYRHNGALLPHLRRGFAAARLPQEWLVLDEFLTMLLGCARQPLEIRTMKAAHVSVDEQQLLHWLAALQRGETPACAAMRAIAAPARQLAASFARVGLVFADGRVERKN